MPFKLVVLVRSDLQLSKGKMSAQVAHAAVECALAVDNDVLDEWRSEGAKKIVLKVADLKELHKFRELAKKEGLVNVIISDAGHTELPPGTITVLGVGPDDEKKIDKVTGKLKLVS